MKRLKLVAVIAIAIAAMVITMAVIRTQTNVSKLEKQTQEQIRQIKDQQESTIKAKSEEVKNLKTTIETKDATVQDLNTKLQSKLEAKKVEVQLASVKVAQAAPTQPVVHVPVGLSVAKMFIYMHESGNRTNAINPNGGACGLGQALPCSKMPCTLSDYACQDNFFTNYMLHRYGTWENAMAFWQKMHWW